MRLAHKFENDMSSISRERESPFFYCKRIELEGFLTILWKKKFEKVSFLVYGMRV
jgi:hypothetical protein